MNTIEPRKTDPPATANLERLVTNGIAKTPDETFDHIKTGYRNAQDTIKFIDTKTGVMTGLLTAATGTPLFFFKWVICLEDKHPASYKSFSASHPISTNIVLFGLLTGMVLGVLGVLCAVDGLMARNPRKLYQGLLGWVRKMWDKVQGRYKKTHDKPPVTVLFPIFKPEEEEYALKYFRDASKRLTREEILAEYRVQVAQVGRILNRKIACNQRSVIFFSLQFLAYALTGLVAFGVARLFLF